MPVTYALIFIMAYYGPNAEIIGNVKFTQWHFNAITDLEEYLSKIALYFIVDLSSAMISGVILWTTCKINIFKMIQKIQKDLWYFIAIYDTSKFFMVSNTLPPSKYHITLHISSDSWSHSSRCLQCFVTKRSIVDMGGVDKWADATEFQ